MVWSPEVDHFNSASQIFFKKKDQRPGDLRTGDRWLNPGWPVRTWALVNTAIISHALISPPSAFVPFSQWYLMLNSVRSFNLDLFVCYCTHCSKSLMLAVVWMKADHWFKGRSLQRIETFFVLLLWGTPSTTQCFMTNLAILSPQSVLQHGLDSWFMKFVSLCGRSQLCDVIISIEHKDWLLQTWKTHTLLL